MLGEEIMIIELFNNHKICQFYLTLIIISAFYDENVFEV